MVRLDSVIYAASALTVYTRHLDTVYGCQDKEGDIKVGVWPTALLFGDRVWFACAILDISYFNSLLRTRTRRLVVGVSQTLESVYFSHLLVFSR